MEDLGNGGALLTAGVDREERRRLQVIARARRAAARSAARAVPPQCSDEFAHLDLGELRAYRRVLTEEEDRVSYWRRILQARIDCLAAGDQVSPTDAAHLLPVLTTARLGSGRRALVRILPVDDIPPLPDLVALWETVILADTASAEELSRDLRAAEAKLSAYRAALHRRLTAATAELIARYRVAPSLCLSILPC